MIQRDSWNAGSEPNTGRLRVSKMVAAGFSVALAASTAVADSTAGRAVPQSIPAGTASTVVLEPVIQIGAGIVDMAVSGDHVFTVAGGQLSVVDVTASGSLAFAAHTPPIDHALRSIVALRDGLVAVRDVESVIFYDSSDPVRPKSLFATDLDYSGFENALCASGDLLLTGNGKDLVPFDISGPVPMPLMANLTTHDPAPMLCAVFGDRAYAIDMDGLAVVDGAGTATATIVSRTLWSGMEPVSSWIPTGAEAKDDLLIISGRSTDHDNPIFEPYTRAQPFIRIFDTSNPAAPVEISAFTTEPDGLRVYPPGSSVAIKGDLALVADETGVRTIDVSSPESPRQLGRVEVGRSEYFGNRELSFMPRAGRAIVLHSEGLTSIDFTDPASPRVVGAIESEYWNAYGPQYDGTDLYVGSSAGLRIVNVSDLRAPTIRHTEHMSSTWSVALSAPAAGLPRQAYVLGQTELRVLDITDPSAVSAIGSIDGSFEQTKVTLGEDHLYVVAPHFETLRVYDVSEPARPRLKRDIPLDMCAAHHIAHWKDALYLLCGDAYGLLPAWIEIYDLSIPFYPREVGTIPLEHRPAVIFADSGRLYDFGGSVATYDLSDPLAPVLLGSFSPGGCIRAMAVEGRRMMATDCDGKLHAWDVSDAAAPALMASVSIVRYHTALWGLAFTGNRVAVIEEVSGITLIDIVERPDPTITPTIAPTDTPAPTATSQPEPGPKFEIYLPSATS